MSHAVVPKPISHAVSTVLTALTVSCLLSACASPAPPRAAARPSAATTAPAAPAAPPALPPPTGGRAVGATVLYLKDASRADPWVPEAKVRELMVTLWYPARTGTGTPAPYMSAKESELTLRGKRVTGAPSDVLSKVRTNARTGAEPDGRTGGLPLVVLSPGFTLPRGTLTALAEDLASHGYVVAGVDHAYENYATTFPGGRVAACVACDSDTDPGFGPRVTDVRAADVSFVLDRLTGPDPAWPGSRLIDRSRIAMAGHSIGGAAAVAAMLKDCRIRAGLDMDGTTYARIPEGGLSRPFLFLGSADHRPGGRDTSWDRDWRLLSGWKRWLTLPGADHQSFTDVPLLAGALGLGAPGSLGAARPTQIVRAYVLAFLDLHLRGRPQPLLDGPSARYPEVRFCAPGRKDCR
ncbi:alpha/beta hydrolase [Nonomuraea sp. NPDC001023]|uniref:alpha/beta hydrolase family protein n=1 Tax=unclassified Nonomuraea TaxID=2593643 RepID=UPI003331F29E